MEKTAAQTLEEQRKRLSSLQERRTRVQVRIENERVALANAQEEAQKLFGTHDLQALRDLHESQKKENERQVVEFVKVLDSVEASLQELERLISA